MWWSLPSTGRPKTGARQHSPQRCGGAVATPDFGRRGGRRGRRIRTTSTGWDSQIQLVGSNARRGAVARWLPPSRGDTPQSRACQIRLVESSVCFNGEATIVVAIFFFILGDSFVVVGDLVAHHYSILFLWRHFTCAAIANSFELQRCSGGCPYLNRRYSASV